MSAPCFTPHASLTDKRCTYQVGGKFPTSLTRLTHMHKQRIGNSFHCKESLKIYISSHALARVRVRVRVRPPTCVACRCRTNRKQDDRRGGAIYHIQVGLSLPSPPMYPHPHTINILPIPIRIFSSPFQPLTILLFYPSRKTYRQYPYFPSPF